MQCATNTSNVKMLVLTTNEKLYVD